LESREIIREIRSGIEAIERDETLYEEANFPHRVETTDFLEFHIIDRINGLLPADGRDGELAALKQQAELVKKRLEEVNEKLFRRLREIIQSGNCSGTELKREFEGYIEAAANERSEADVVYDSLDVLINGVQQTGIVPEQSRAREPEMVFYQPTPARIVFELVEKVGIREDDVFYDLGSGLGQVPILVNLLSGARARGIEFDPAYCDYGQQCARGLSLSRVEFINVDARQADYSDGTIFFMYTPFEGQLLEDVLKKLERESRKREIRISTYGTCTLQVSRHSWLERVDHNANPQYKLAVYRIV